MSTRDWSEAYFADESSVHGRGALAVSGGVEAVSRVDAASRAYNEAKDAKAAAVATYLVPVAALPSEIADWITDNEVAAEGRKRMPGWMADAVAAHDAAVEAAHDAAVEAFMESDEAEAVIAALVAARAEYDAAVAEEDAAAKEAVDQWSALSAAAGWIIVPSRSDAVEVSEKTGVHRWSGAPRTACDRMVVTVAEAAKLTHPCNADRFVPAKVVVYGEDQIKAIGFDYDLSAVLSRVTPAAQTIDSDR